MLAKGFAPGSRREEKEGSIATTSNEETGAKNEREPRERGNGCGHSVIPAALRFTASLQRKRAISSRPHEKSGLSSPAASRSMK
jgi:hypothetical protein